jgi:hypothetical protein
MSDIVERLEADDELCPFCERDPYHYVDIGVGYQRAAVVCCSLGIAYFQDGDDQLQKELNLRTEAAATIRQQREEIAGLKRALGVAREVLEHVPADGTDFDLSVEYAISAARSAEGARTAVEQVEGRG